MGAGVGVGVGVGVGEGEGVRLGGGGDSGEALVCHLLLVLARTLGPPSATKMLTLTLAR